MKHGIIRRIGNGETTDPWNDQWIPHDGTLRPVACLTVKSPSHVLEFIDRGTTTWKEEKLQQYMLPMDVELILQIPICTRQHEDFWAWHYDRHGLFSIQSAYRMLVATRDRREAWLDGTASSSNGAMVEKEWTSLWQTPVPAKIKCFCGV
jgi:hypothetical protein